MASSRARRNLVENLEARRFFAVGPFVSKGPGGGEELFSPSFDPTSPANLTLSSQGGYFRSADSGATWNLTDHNQIVGGVGSRTAYTSNPNIRYSLTTDVYTDSQLVRTTDGGATWGPVPGWTQPEAFQVYTDPTTTTRVLVATYDAIFYSNDGGATFSQKVGIFNAGTNSDYVAGAFFDGNNIYVGTSAGLLVSTDAGNTFNFSTATGLPANTGMISFAGAKLGMTTRLFATLTDRANLYSGQELDDASINTYGVYTLTIGTTAWASKAAAFPANQHPFYLAMATGDVTDVYVGGYNSNTGGVTVAKTTDFGTHWTDVFTTANNANIATGWESDLGDVPWVYGLVSFGIAVAPSNVNDVLVTDMAGAYLTTNGGTAWHSVTANPADLNPAGTGTFSKPYRGNGLESGNSTWLTWADANTMVAGYDDIRAVQSTDGGASWALPAANVANNTIEQITTVANASSPSGVTMYGAASNLRDIYSPIYLGNGPVDFGKGKLIYSNDKGANWSLLHDFQHPVLYTAIDPTSPNRMFAAVASSTQGGIYVTPNLNAGAGSTWTKLASPTRAKGHPLSVFVLNDGTIVAVYTATATSGGYRPTLSATSGVFVSTDHGLTWSDRTLIGAPASPGMQYWTQNLTIDPTDATQNTWYAGVRSSPGGDGSADFKGGLYKTTDRGVNWTRIYSDDSVEASVINPTNGDLYVATTSSGIVTSHNPNAATPTFTQTSYPYMHPQRLFIDPYDPNQLWVTSFGYGLSEASIASPAPTVTASTFNFETGPQSVAVQFSTDVSASLTKSDFVLTNTGTNVAVPQTSLGFSYNATTNTATLSYTPGALPDGNYRLTLPAGSVASAGGTPLAADYNFTFFTLAGDANRDRVVNFSDLVILAQNYGKTGKTFSQGNFDYSADGTVGFSDLVILAQHYNQSVSLMATIDASAGTSRKHDPTPVGGLAELE